MRLFSLTPSAALVLALCAGCTGNMTAPSASEPSAGAIRFDRPQSSQAVAIQTSDGDYVVDVGSGGGRAKGHGCQFALNNDATTIGPWETFTLVSVTSEKYAFQTIYGDYVTAVAGGGIGGSVKRYGPLQTNGKRIGRSEKFQIVALGSNPPQVAIQTPDGEHYVTAVAGGGMGGCRFNLIEPFQTDAARIGEWEEFTLVSK
ncbi:MAG: hypothetical protein WCC84_01130 [Candidatus Cybelea sp.]